MLPSAGLLESDTNGPKLEHDKSEKQTKTLKRNFDNSTSEVIVLDDDNSENESIDSISGKREADAKRSNPFALFAFQSAGHLPENKERDFSTSSTSRFQKWEPAAPKSNKKAKIAKSKCTPFLKMNDISAEEQERIKKKWQSLVDPVVPLEVKRFQMLVAARLHARCQEASVRKAMNRLREAFPRFTVDTLADADPESLVPCIKNVVHYNVKAQHIVKAAQEVKHRFNGAVPEDEKSLMELTGIGNVFADLLSFVNTRAAYGEPTEEQI